MGNDRAVVDDDEPIGTGDGRKAQEDEKCREKRSPVHGCSSNRRCLQAETRLVAESFIVPVSIERGLLKEADSFARRHKLKRSQMVAQGLRLVMQKAG